MMGNRWCPQEWTEGTLWEQVYPCLDGRCFQHRVAVSDNRKAAVLDAIHGTRLLLDGLHHYFSAAGV